MATTETERPRCSRCGKRAYYDVLLAYIDINTRPQWWQGMQQIDALCHECRIDLIAWMLDPPEDTPDE